MLWYFGLYDQHNQKNQMKFSFSPACRARCRENGNFYHMCETKIYGNGLVGSVKPHQTDIPIFIRMHNIKTWFNSFVNITRLNIFIRLQLIDNLIAAFQNLSSFNNLFYTLREKVLFYDSELKSISWMEFPVQIILWYLKNFVPMITRCSKNKWMGSSWLIKELSHRYRQSKQFCFF